MGAGFGSAMMLLGVLGVLTGQLLTGLWWMMLGWFLRGASESSYQQVIVRQTLEGEPGGDP